MEVLGPHYGSPQKWEKYLKIHMGHLAFFLVAVMLVRREGPFLLLPDLLFHLLFSLGSHSLELSVLEDV